MAIHKQALERQVARFREWADTYAKSYDGLVEQLRGEWEWDYEHWQPLYQAVFDILDAVPATDWDGETVRLLLFALARDNEAERIAEELAARPDAFLILARASLDSTEAQAKWQIAAQLSTMKDPPAEAHWLLESLARDEDEYVRRRALMSLGILGSPAVEGLVDAAWATGDEYQRMAAISALADIKSPRLDDYLARAESDGRAYLVAHAARVRSGEDHL